MQSSERPIPETVSASTNTAIPLEDCLVALLRGIQDHTVIAEGSSSEEFRAEMAALEKGFRDKNNGHQLVDAVVAVLDKYSIQANQTMARQKSGLVTAASELSQAIKTLPNLERSTERLSIVEQQIKAISSQDDLNVVKARLGAQIAVARAEVLQERHKIGELFNGIIGKLEMPLSQLSNAARQAESGYRLDQLTGLPSRTYAEAELTRAYSRPQDAYAVLFVVKRLALINAKFGYSRGDQVLLKVVVHLAQSLPDFNNLFRWAPCAFLTVAPPDVSFKELRSKVQIIELTRMAPTLEWEGRSAMVPVGIDCRIMTIKDFTTPADLFLRLDTLAADA